MLSSSTFKSSDINLRFSDNDPITRRRYSCRSRGGEKPKFFAARSSNNHLDRGRKKKIPETERATCQHGVENKCKKCSTINSYYRHYRNAYKNCLRRSDIFATRLSVFCLRSTIIQQQLRYNTTIAYYIWKYTLGKISQTGAGPYLRGYLSGGARLLDLIHFFKNFNYSSQSFYVRILFYLLLSIDR